MFELLYQLPQLFLSFLQFEHQFMIGHFLGKGRSRKKTSRKARYNNQGHKTHVLFLLFEVVSLFKVGIGSLQMVHPDIDDIIEFSCALEH